MSFTRATTGEQITSKYDVALLPGYPEIDEGCEYAHCSRAVFMLAVNKLSQDDQEAGGTGSITLKTKSGLAISTFEYDFRAAGDPEVVGWNPKVFPLDGGVSVNMYVKNFPQAGCNSDSTCAQKAKNSGLSVQIDSAPVFLQSLQDSNGMLVVTFVAPAKGRCISGQTSSVVIRQSSCVHGVLPNATSRNQCLGRGGRRWRFHCYHSARLVEQYRHPCRKGHPDSKYHCSLYRRHNAEQVHPDEPCDPLRGKQCDRQAGTYFARQAAEVPSMPFPACAEKIFVVARLF
jgi:hypothetical protein